MVVSDLGVWKGAGVLVWAARLLLAAYLVALGVVVLSSDSVEQDRLLQDFQGWLGTQGLPLQVLTFARLEVLANVAIVMPVGLMGVLAFPRLRWQDWTAYAFLGALAVELVQGLLLPSREMSAVDIVANTSGAAAGALVGWALRAVVRR